MVVDGAHLGAAAESRRGRVDDPRKGGFLEQDPRQVGQVGRRGVVAGRVEADRGGVVGVREPQPRRRPVHLRHERRHGARDAVGQRRGRVAAARQQHPVHQVAHRVPLPRPQAQQRLAGLRRVFGRGDALAHPQVAQGEIRRHQLRRRGDRELAIGVAGGEAVAVGRVDQEPGPGVDPRRLRRLRSLSRGGRSTRGRGRGRRQGPPRDGSAAVGELLAAVRNEVDAVLRLELKRVEVRVELLQRSRIDALGRRDPREAVARLDDVVVVLRARRGLGRRRVGGARLRVLRPRSR